MKSIKSFKAGAIVLSVLTILLGSAMIIWPDISAVAACYVLGIVSLVIGIYEIFRYFNIGFMGFLFRYDLAAGILSIFIGILFLCHPLGAMTILPIVLGFDIVVTAVFFIQLSLELSNLGSPGQLATLLFGVTGIILGILMILDPFNGAHALMIFLGISLIITGGQSIGAIIYAEQAFRSSGHQNIIDAVWQECE